MPTPVAIDVAFLPRDATNLADSVAIVVDVLRASSTIVTLLERGAASVGLAGSVEAARRAARQAPGTLLCGETGGLPPYGFDYGNSPLEFSRLDLAGKHFVMATTNGTNAVRACRDARTVLVGALINANAVLREVMSLLRELSRVTIVCAGVAGQFVLDDAITAGYFCHLLLNETRVRKIPLAETNSAIAAYRLYHSYPNLLAGLNESESALNLLAVRLGDDVSYCARTSTVKLAPRLGTTEREGLYLL